MNFNFDNKSVHDLFVISIRNEDDKNPSYTQKDVFSVLHSRLHNMSVFELLQMLLATKYTEFFDQREVFIWLSTKTGQHIDDDIDQWVAWFLNFSSDLLDSLLNNNIEIINELTSDKDERKMSIAVSYAGYKGRQGIPKSGSVLI